MSLSSERARAEHFREGIGPPPEDVPRKVTLMFFGIYFSLRDERSDINFALRSVLKSFRAAESAQDGRKKRKERLVVEHDYSRCCGTIVTRQCGGNGG